MGDALTTVPGSGRSMVSASSVAAVGRGASVAIGSLDGPAAAEASLPSDGWISYAPMSQGAVRGRPRWSKPLTGAAAQVAASPLPMRRVLGRVGQGDRLRRAAVVLEPGRIEDVGQRQAGRDADDARELRFDRARDIPITLIADQQDSGARP